MRQVGFRSLSLLAVLLSASVLLAAYGAQAQTCAPFRPLPAPGSWSVLLSPDGTTTTINTAPSFFPPGDSFGPNPTNLLPTIYLNACDSAGNAIPNTLPSTPNHPYNLHPDPVVTPLADLRSPKDDLHAILTGLHLATLFGQPVDLTQVQFGIDILEGNTVNRAYSGFSLLHYKGPTKTQVVTPIMQNGVVVGGTVTIHMVYYDTHIESDTSYLDPTAVLDVPWTIHYVVDVLRGGYDDFAGYVMYFDDPKNYSPPANKPNVGMDDSFFPMADGNRYTFDVAMAPGRFWNLTYHWGWRKHPPRVQVVENVLVKLGARPRNAIEFDAFCPLNQQPNFTCPALLTSPSVKLAAINMIGDVAPAKRMWNDFQAILAGTSTAGSLLPDLDSAFDDWQHRNRLPAGVTEDPTADETLLFVNDTIYGHIKGLTGEMEPQVFKYAKRGDQVKVSLQNGDYFPHAYMLVDFGGMRGWENTFHSTLSIGGQGPLFTFGRNYWWIHTATGPVPIPVATRPTTKPGPVVTLTALSALQPLNDPDTPEWNRIWKTMPTQINNVQGIGMHNVVVNFNSDPPQRIRLYQFDGFHHDIGIWSPH